MTAQLVLTNASATTGGTISVYAADNDWTGSVNWGSKPTNENVALISKTLGAGVNTFGVKNYISGPGDYTFCIQYSEGTEVSFYSAESAFQPQLKLTEPDATIAGEFYRPIDEVIQRGNLYRARYLALNGGTNSEADHDLNMVGFFDVTKHPYFAQGDGTLAGGGTDDTLAIQRCINEARDAQVAVFFPAGMKFRVTAPLECVQGLIDYETGTTPRFASTGYERANHRDFPSVLMGPVLPLTDGSRPQILADKFSSAFAGFDPDGAGPNPEQFFRRNPVLHFWSRGKGEAQVPATKNYPAGNYNHLVRNLDFNLNQRRGASAINMVGTQGTAIESLNIFANGAYAGITGLPGAGGCTSAVKIKGGKYGIDAFENSTDGLGITSVLNNCTIDNNSQTSQDYSIRWNHLGPLVLVGCTIKGMPIRIDGPGSGANDPDTGVPVPGQDGNVARGNLNIVDSTIELSSSGAAIIGTRSAYLRNVYCKNVSAVADIQTTLGNDTPTSVPTTTFANPWFLVIEYAEGAWLNQYGGDVEPTPRYINWQHKTGSEAIVSTYHASIFPAPPSNLLARHIWPEAVNWDAADVINVKDLLNLPGFTAFTDPPRANAKGDNTGDDWKAIDDAVRYADANGKRVFIPAGHYRLGKTLTLKYQTVLSGLHRSYTVLKANDHTGASPFVGTLGTGSPLVKTVNTSGGTTRLSDLMLMQRMTAKDTYLLNWRAGEHSVVQNVNFERRIVAESEFGGVIYIMNIPLVTITDNGGGRWYSMNHQSAGNVNTSSGSNYRNVQALNTTQALKFYMLNPEIDEDNIYNAEFNNCVNLDIFGTKAEGKESPFLRISGGSDIRVMGLGGNAYCSVFLDENDQLTGVDEGVIEIENCPSFVFGTGSFHKNTTNEAPDPERFFRLREFVVGTDPDPLLGSKGFISYRVGSNSLINDDN